MLLLSIIFNDHYYYRGIFILGFFFSRFWWTFYGYTFWAGCSGVLFGVAWWLLVSSLLVGCFSCCWGVLFGVRRCWWLFCCFSGLVAVWLAVGICLSCVTIFFSTFTSFSVSVYNIFSVYVLNLYCLT